jgi:MFS family permease
MKAGNRWVIAIAGVFLQIALGAVYAWSVFRIPLSKQFGWSISEVTFTFTISIFVLGFAAFFGGLWMNRKGPRIVALTAATLYGLGVFLASFSANKLWWPYFSYGFIGGLGLGLGYIVPVAVLVKWFPDRRGLITGIAVGGFGAGALITAPVASRLIQVVGVLPTFAYLGVAYFIVAIIAALFMRNPPEGWQPEGWTPTEKQVSQRASHDFVLPEALKAWQWWVLWLILSQYLCRHRCDFAGSSNLSGVDRSHGGCRRWDGRCRQPRQRRGSRLLGVALGPYNAARDVCSHVYLPSRAVLVPATYHRALGDDHDYFHYTDVLRRGIRHHACIHG